MIKLRCRPDIGHYNQSYLTEFWMLFLLLLILDLSLLVFKWSFILKKQGIQLPFLYLFKIYMIGLFYGVITPAKAGSLGRIFYIKNKTNKSLVEISSSIVIERALDLITILFLSGLGALFLFKNIAGLTTKLIISFILIISICIFFISESRSKFVFSLIFKYVLPKNLKEKVNNSFSEFYKSIPSAKNIFIFFLLTIITWTVVAIKSVFMARAFSINTPFLSAATIFLISIAIGTLPITISGLGTREATLIALFNLFDIPIAKVMSMAVILLLFGSVIPAFIGYLISLKEEIPKNEILNNNSTSPK